MLSNIFNKAFKKSEFSVSGLSLIYDHYYQDLRWLIPTLGVEGSKGFNFHLVFNENYLMPEDNDFGMNVRFSLYRKFVENTEANSWTVTTSDEYSETFIKTNKTIVISNVTYNIFLAKTEPLKLYVSQDKSELRIVDNNETHYIYQTANEYNYPTKISDKTWNSINFQNLSNGFRYFNGKLDFVDFIKDDSSYVNVINVYHNNTKTAVTKLTYTNDMLSKVQMYYLNPTETLIAEYELKDALTNEYGSIKETLSKETLFYTIKTEGIDVQRGVGLTTSNKNKYEVITLNKRFSICSSNPNYKVKHFYVAQGNKHYSSFDADNLGNVSLSEYSQAGYVLFGHKVSFDETLSGNDNLLVNGNFDDGFDSWNTETGFGQLYEGSSEDPCLELGNNNVLLSIGTAISQSVQTIVKPNEGIRLSFFHKNYIGVSGEKIGEVILDLTKEDGTIEQHIKDIKQGEGEHNKFAYKSVEIIPSEKITNIKVTIKTLEDKSFYIRNLFLTKGDIGRTYTYDALNRITGIKSKSETKIFTDKNGNVIGEFSKKRNYKEHKYGEYNVLLESKDNLGTRTIHSYDTDYYDNVIKSITYFDNQYIQTEKTYSNMGKDVSTETSSNNKVTTYDYDAHTRLLDSITDANSVTYTYLFNSKKLPTTNITTHASFSSLVTISHYEDYNVKEYVNGSLKYLFTYNTEGKLKKVQKLDTENEKTEDLISIYYDYEIDSTKYVSNNIVKVIDKSGFITLFEYDLFGNITKTTRGAIIYVYEYDSLQRITKTYETNEDLEEINSDEYTYNVKSQIVKEKQDDFVSEYKYDEEEKLKERLFGETSCTYLERINNLDSSKKNLYHNKKALHEYNGYGCFYEKDKVTGVISEHLTNVLGEKLLCNRRDTLCHNGEFGWLDCLSDTSSSFDGCILESTYPKISLTMSFNVVEGELGGLFCLYFRNGVCMYGEIVYDEENDTTWLVIKGKKGSTTTVLYEVGFDSKYGKWTSLGFTFDQTRNKVNFVCDMLYGETDFQCSSLINVEGSLFLGCLHLDGNITDSIECQITNVILTKNAIMSVEDMCEIGNESLYVINNGSSYLNSDNKTNMASSLMLREDIYVNTFPLNKTLKNRNDEYLKIYKQIPGVELFEYNTALKDYAFCAKGNTLLKTLSDPTSVSAVANVYFEEDADTSYMRQIFEIVDGNSRVDFYRNNNKYLCIRYKGVVTNTGLYLEDKTWATVSVGMEAILTSDSVDTEYYNFRITLDGESFETQISTGDDYYYSFSKFDVYAGGGKLSSVHKLNGNMNDVYIIGSYLSTASIEQFMNDKETIVYHEYNSIGQLIEEGVKTRNRTITKKVYEYETSGNRNMGNLAKVTQDGVDTVIATDNVGNITQVGNMTYSYDYLNRLHRAIGNGVTREYGYDDKGNIQTVTTNGNVTRFIYENDKLKSYGDKTLTYDTNGRITNCNILKFNWSGNKVSSVGVSGSNVYTFEYNQNGLRKKKSNYKAGTYVTYTYEGDLLVKQYDGTNKLFYLYDENNKLYGIIWNGTKYFYKRNIIDEIVGIVDFDGTVVVEYSYDPFGKLLSTTGSLSSTLGVLNSILYKGYVYDHESALYYCKTRFYYPEICRWISEDSTRYLDQSSVNGLNLYSYCYNNPVNYKQGPVSSGGSVTSSSISGEGSSGSGSVSNGSAPWYVQTIVGAIPDLYSGIKYLSSKGMYRYFAYKKNYYYMFPETKIFPKVIKTHKRLAIHSTSFGKLSNATFRELVTGDAKASIGSVIGNILGVGGFTFGTNLLFNLYENGFDLTDGAMWLDTVIDTTIGMGAYGLAIGTATLATAGLAMVGVALPGIIVVGGVIILSIGFDHLIRAIFGYWD